MFRFKIAMIVIGGVLGFFGIQELMVSCGTSQEASVVDLADLEGGASLDNNHIQVGPHIALYPGSVFEYRESGAGGQSPASTVTHCYYPVVSLEHPFVEALRADNESFEFENIALLVKTKRFKTIGAIPDDVMREESIQGLVINQIGSLDKEEKDLLNESFPRIDPSEVLILQEGRKPASLLWSMAMTLGGVALIVVGIGLFFVGRGS